jgi:predicted AlkP superfamily pyrophosphatase or phosphodiesterase
VLISVAGLEAGDFLNAWGYVASDGDAVRMPRLSVLAREGVVGDRAMPPAPGSSYASHATLLTGQLPARHGITADSALDEEGKRALPFWDARLLKSTPLWDAAIGRGVLSLGWPTTSGGRIELIVPDSGPDDLAVSWLEHLRRVGSPSLVRDLESLAAEAGVDVEADKEGDSESSSRKRDARSWPTPEEKDAAFAELACRVAASERDPGLWLIRLNQTESIFHDSGFGSVEVDRALSRVDAAIGRIFDCLEAQGQVSETAFFIVGDVVYRPVDTRVDPNVALLQAGLLGRDPRSATGVRSWLATVRSNGRSAYVYARDAPNAVLARETLETEAKRTGAFRIVPARELAAAGADPQAWFGLAAAPGYVIGNGLVRPALRPADWRSAAGGFPFFAETTASVPGSRLATDLAAEDSAVGFVAWGRGIRNQVRIPVLELVDVAPTIASLLGLRLDEELDGEPLIGILRAAVPPPPPGPKRLGVGGDGNIDRTLRDLGGGRRRGGDR